MIANPCRCNCGYRCGGPGQCELAPLVCVNQVDGKHYVKDCDHDWTGESEEGDYFGSGFFSSATCANCGMSTLHHDMKCGP